MRKGWEGGAVRVCVWGGKGEVVDVYGRGYREI